MGYTHYWNFAKAPISSHWEVAIATCDRIIEEAVEYDLDREFNNNDTLAFNGTGESSHETFTVPRTRAGIRAQIKKDLARWGPNDGAQIGFDFCKTAQKPYDDVVVACLCVLAEAGLNVSSDGEPHEWEAGRELAERILGWTVSLPKTLTA